MTFPKTLVVEDDPNAALLLQMALKRAQVQATVHFVSDGVEAIDYLRGKQLFDKVAASTLPELLLLDLSMPRLNGFGVLEWLRMHPHLRPARVVVLTSSADPQDWARAQALGADDYLLKPAMRSDLSNLVHQLRRCALGQSLTLPSEKITQEREPLWAVP